MRNAPTTDVLEPQPVSVRVKLAAAWTSVMFLFAYMDILTFYKPGIIEDILDGVVHEFAISQTFLVLAVSLMTVPIAMVLLSTTLPARASRVTSIVVASIYVLPTAYNLDGETWTEFGGFFGLGVALELAVLAFIIRTAWTWPRTPRPGSDVEASRPLRTARTS
jgi:hypothetical protein